MENTTDTLKADTPGKLIPDPWEAAYLRFETPEQEIQKFIARLNRLGAPQWPRDSEIVELFCGRGNGLIASNASASLASKEWTSRPASSRNSKAQQNARSPIAASFPSLTAARTSSSFRAVCTISPPCLTISIKLSPKCSASCEKTAASCSSNHGELPF